YVPDRLVLQWHITDRCNMRCGHCYQDGISTPEPSWDQLVYILEQYKQILNYWRRVVGKRVTGHINITGGEPFLRRDFFDFLALLAKGKHCFSYAILTNGHLCTEDVCKRLRALKPKFVQVSLDGGLKTHDAIRQPGSFAEATAALQRLKRHGICTLVAFTAGSENYGDFPAVVRAAREVGAYKVWADRLIPMGTRGGNSHSLSPAESRELFTLMVGTRQKKKWWKLCSTRVSMNRALQFLQWGDEPYSCKAGDALLAVLPSGDLLPCRRMPIVVGNLFRTDLIELYYNSNLLFLLREKERVAKGCEQCAHVTKCRGGLRCLSYALYGDPFLADPGCWLASES
ncbi:MAG: radical SAM protein, partial [Desulfobulbaceae bacterium]|nr:radical SAM protein [Desulfobulbaceae bacterium]